mgnify:CR=1 FL=1
MKEIEKSMLVLPDRSSKLINLIAQIIDLWPPRQMSDILEILQSSPDFRSVAFDL